MRSVNRHLRLAWLEYEDSRDGAVFTHAATSRLGFENALSTLPRAGSASARRAKNLFYTRILLKTFGKPGKGAFRGLLAIPGDGDQMTLEQWVTSPAIEDGRFVSDAEATSQVDLLAVSGHGSSGEVWGDASGDRTQINLASAFGEYIDEDRSGRLKCLLVPTCNNVHEAVAESWLPLFNHEKPVHVLLGYEGSYTGGALGAKVMANFVNEMATRPTTPIVEAWKTANESVRQQQPWAALVAKGAEGMSLQRWLDDSLPRLTGVNDLVHFSSGHPKGRRPPLGDQPYEVRWVMEDGTVIDRQNNLSSNERIGLFEGKAGKIRIRAMKPGTTLKRGQQVYLMIYLYRGSKSMKINSLLTFDSNLQKPHANTGEPVVTVEDDKAVFNQIFVDAVRIVVPSDTDVLQLGFTISPSATKTYSDTGPRATHGRFILDFVYEYAFFETLDQDQIIDPGLDEHRNVYAANAGALLRK